MPMRVRERGKTGREEERGKKKERSVCRKLSLPCSIMGVLNTAKHFKVRFSTGRGAQWNDLYFKSGCEQGYRSPLLSPVFISFSSNLVTVAEFEFFFSPFFPD